MKKILPMLLVASTVGYSQPLPTKIPDSLFAAQQWQAAIPLYENAVKSGVNTALTWNRLGFCYHNVGQIDAAIKDYEISLSNKPAAFLEQVVQSRLARAYSVKNLLDKAFASLDKALTLGYSNTTELETHGDFANVRKDKRFDNAKKRANE